MVDLEMSPIL